VRRAACFPCVQSVKVIIFHCVDTSQLPNSDVLDNIQWFAQVLALNATYKSGGGGDKCECQAFARVLRTLNTVRTIFIQGGTVYAYLKIRKLRALYITLIKLDALHIT
jgi:hypothetical protein